MGAANDSASRFCPPITFLSPDNGGTEGGVKTIEEPKGVQRPLKKCGIHSGITEAQPVMGEANDKYLCSVVMGLITMS